MGFKAVTCNGKYGEGGGEIGDGFVGEISFTGGFADWEDVVGDGINEGDEGDWFAVDGNFIAAGRGFKDGEPIEMTESSGLIFTWSFNAARCEQRFRSKN